MNRSQGNIPPAKRSSVPRKRACQPCTVARARCDLIRPNCTRCVDKQLPCEYSVPAAAGARVRRRIEDSCTVLPAVSSSSGSNSLAHPPSGLDSSPAVDGALLYSTSETTAITTQTPSHGNLQPPDLISSSNTACPVFADTIAGLLAPLDVSRIRDRWLDCYFTPTTKQVKEYPARVMALMSRTVSSYPAMWIRNQSHPPPFIHLAQCRQNATMPEPLANCLSLLRLCASAAPGSDDLVRDSVQREMSRLATVVEEGVRSQTGTLTHHLSCLSALQAYLLLSIHAYFVSKTRPDLRVFTPDLITTLLDLTSKVSAVGIMCHEEVGGTMLARPPIPPWESWIIAEAKRRTIFCVYMFEDVCNYENHAATYLAEELAPLLAPASKWIWHAADRKSFKAEYLEWLKAWDGERGLAISELWPNEPGENGNDADEARRRNEKMERISRWSESVDEFGMFILAVCTATHNA